MNIRAFYTQILQIKDEELIRELMDVTEIEYLKKGEKLIEREAQQTHLVFLLKGILRGYLGNVQGKEITDCFGFRCGEPAMACHGLGQPAQITIEALTDTQVLLIPISTIMVLLEKYPILVYIYNRILVDALQWHWEVKNVRYQYNAMERYQWFLKTYPGLIDQVNHKHIASFLDMTPATLSHIRRNLHEEEL